MTAKSVIRLESEGPEGAGLVFWGHLESEKVLEGEPTETGHTYYENDTGQLSCGVWDCTPCTTQVDSYPVDEFCVVLRGRVTITDAGGHAETFQPGDCFVVPKGMWCQWHMPEGLRKYFVILADKAEAD